MSYSAIAMTAAPPSINAISFRWPWLAEPAPDCSPALAPVVCAAPAVPVAVSTEPVTGAFTTTTEVAVVSCPLGRVKVLRISWLDRWYVTKAMDEATVTSPPAELL